MLSIDGKIVPPRVYENWLTIASRFLRHESTQSETERQCLLCIPGAIYRTANLKTSLCNSSGRQSNFVVLVKIDAIISASGVSQEKETIRKIERRYDMFPSPPSAPPKFMFMFIPRLLFGRRLDMEVDEGNCC